MRVHLLTLPNAPLQWKYDLDGFNVMNLRFAKLLKDLGHTVIAYGVGDYTDAPVDEYVRVVTMEEHAGIVGTQQYQHAVIEAHTPLWQLAAPRMIAEVGARKQPGDIFCTLGGGSHAPVMNAHPDIMPVEYSIGYVGSYSPYRVFQSQAWKHASYGRFGIDVVRFYDDVIPGFFDREKFPVNAPQDYLVYVGRLTPRKGIGVVCAMAKAAGVNVKFIGHGDTSLITYGEYLGPLPELERNDVVSRARALVCPTLYVEPYGCISPEAQMSGVPVISTDCGGFTETVEQGVTGFRCNIFGEFVEAVKSVNDLDRKYIQTRAQALYSMEAAAVSYAKYFRRLSTLWGQGWNTHPYVA